MTDEKDKDKKKDPVNMAGSIASMLGLAGTAAMAIPGLRKPKKSNASANAAAKASSQVARAVVSGSQTSLGQHGGQNFMQGLREGARVAPAAAYAQAQAADADQRRFEARKDTRNANLAAFGKDMGAAVAATTGELAMQTQARQKEKALAGSNAPNTDPYAQPGMITGYESPTPQAPPGSGMVSAPPGGVSGGPWPGIQTQTPQELEQQVTPQSLAANQATQRQMEPLARPLYDPTLAYLGLPQAEELRQISPELENQLRMQNYARDEAYRLGIPEATIHARVSRLMNLPAVREWSQVGEEF